MSDQNILRSPSAENPKSLQISTLTGNSFFSLKRG